MLYYVSIIFIGVPGFHIGLRISWILSNIAYPVAFVITTIYWTVLYKGLTGLKLYNSINCHAIQVNNVNRYRRIELITVFFCYSR